MKLFITILLTIILIPAFGQNHFVGINGGVSLTNIRSSVIKKGTDYKTGFIGGLSYDYRLKSIFNLGIGLQYAQKGYEQNIIFTDENGFSTGETYTFYIDYDYFSIPIKAGFTFGERLIGFGNIGAVPSFLVNAKIHEPAIKNLFDSRTTDYTDELAKLDLAGILEIGIGYGFSDKFQIFTSVAYQHSFTSIRSKDKNIEYVRKNLYGMHVSAGIKYALKQN